MTASLSDDEIEERYFLLGRMEILSVLNDLIHRRASITIHFNSGRDFYQTTLLEARQDALIFDLSGDAKTNQRLTASTGCIFVGRINGIRVQFSGNQPQRFSWGGSDAFCVSLPERVVRLQRRESYRILLPVAKPMMAKFFCAEGSSLGEWPAHDLSVSGLGITVIGDPALALGEKIHRLRLALPKQRLIDCVAVVHHVTQLAERAGKLQYRIGMSFSELAPATSVSIQRYITRIEHERRKLGGGRR